VGAGDSDIATTSCGWADVAQGMGKLTGMSKTYAERLMGQLGGENMGS
jgi:hypothetical protein